MRYRQLKLQIIIVFNKSNRFTNFLHSKIKYLTQSLFYHYKNANKLNLEIVLYFYKNQIMMNTISYLLDKQMKF